MDLTWGLCFVLLWSLVFVIIMFCIVDTYYFDAV